MTNEINVRFSKDDLCQMLKKNLNKNSDKVAEVLTEHITKAGATAFQQCFKALMGIYPSIKYKPGDIVYVYFSNLPTWRLDKEKTLQVSGVKGELIPVKIINADKYSDPEYQIEFYGVSNGESKISVHNYIASDALIEYKEEQLEDFLEEIEKSADNPDDILF
jgi:hypothetical protein